MSSSHDNLRHLTAGYVLGILDADEKRVFEPHVRDCPECKDEVASLFVAVEVLAGSVPQQRPPPDLVQRVLAAALGSQPPAMAIMADPDLVRIELKGQGTAAGASGRVLWSRQHGMAFAGTNLPARQTGQHYEIWVVTTTATLRVGVLHDYSAGLAVLETPRDLASPISLLVTVEAPGERQGPTGEVLLAGTVSNLP